MVVMVFHGLQLKIHRTETTVKFDMIAPHTYIILFISIFIIQY